MISIIRAFRGLYRLCQCGCGILIKIVTKHYQIRSFVTGHHGRLRIGNKHHNWKGGIKTDEFGYILIYKPYCVFAYSDGYVRQHRYIMYIYLSTLNGKPTYIPNNIEIHHKNGITNDNRIDNLQMVTKKEHGKITVITNPNAFKSIDTSGYFCSDPDCEHPYITNKTSKGSFRWFGDGKGGHLCSACYQRFDRKRKKLMKINQFL